MLKVLAACGSGMGSSMIVKMKIEKALQENGIEDYKVDSCSIGEAKSASKNYDVVFASKYLINELEGLTTAKLIGLENLMDDKEISAKLAEGMK